MMPRPASVFQLNIGPGGVPKYGVSRARVTRLGLEGDAVRNPRVHGGPDRAICLYSLEHIQALQEEKHPAFPGSLGENITTLGLATGTLQPGDRVAIGETVELEITSYTAPCTTIAGSFADGDSLRISQKTRPGWSRLYARVLTEGTIAIGDAIRVTAGPTTIQRTLQNEDIASTGF